MKFRYTGNLPEVTIRHMTFPAGQAVEVTDEELARKLAGIPFFSEVKPGRPKNADES